MNLKKGDTIGIAATSGPFDIDRFNSGIEIIRSMGFKVLIPESIYEKRGYLAGSDGLRLKTLMDLYINKDIKGIFCARGGYGVHRILNRIDYNIIRKNPKTLVGFSDVTALLIAVNQRAGLTTFHGPVVTSLELLDSDNINRIFKTLSLEDGDSYTVFAHEPHVISGGVAEGKLIGGNLCMLSHLLGTPFQPDFDGKILFFEDVNEPVYKIDRMLTHLDLAGVTKNIRAMVLGSFKGCGESKEIYGLIREKYTDQNIPILAGMGFGHGKINDLLPIGAQAVINADSGTLKIKL